jgi:predicted flap endonuclease-1-like 5' DNA nuclease
LQLLGTFILRLIGVALLSVLLGIVTWLLAQIRPSTIHATRAVMLDQPALSFVVGILANVVLILTAAFFAVTICLVPLSLITLLLVIALNTVGWAVISSVVSRRLLEGFKWSIRWDYALGLTAAVLAGGLGLLWAMGGCFRFFGFVGMLIVSSVGAGAFLLPYIRKPSPDSKTSFPETSSTGLAAVAREGEETRTAKAEVEQRTDVAEPGADTQAPADDFTRIRGLGPVAAGRLTSAGVMTFAVLAQMTPEQIGEILSWSPDRVRQTNIVGQAANLAGDDA